jgi:hypothetical protein
MTFISLVLSFIRSIGFKNKIKWHHRVGHAAAAIKAPTPTYVCVLQVVVLLPLPTPT